jgi:hypothetical protein
LNDRHRLSKKESGTNKKSSVKHHPVNRDGTRWDDDGGVSGNEAAERGAMGVSSTNLHNFCEVGGFRTKSFAGKYQAYVSLVDARGKRESRHTHTANA